MRSAAQHWTAAGLLAALALAPAVALAAPTSLGEAVFNRRASDGRHALRAPPIARYVADEGPSFVLERRGDRALLRFDDADEVLVLRPDRSPRGDLIWRNDVGRPVLTATRLGGMTVFTPARPGGAPVAFASAANPLRPPAISPQALLVRIINASTAASRAAGRMIAFEGLMDMRPGEEPFVAEAGALASAAIVRSARSARPARVLGRLRLVRITRGRAPSVSVTRDTVLITVVPAHGAAGRPSSDRIALALANAR